MKCENCRGYNAHVIKIDEDEKHILCPTCLKIFQQLNDEYYDVVGIDELTSSGHRDDSHT